METFYIQTDIQKDIFVELTDPCEVIHAFASLRIKPGDEVEVINGKGDRYSAKVIECTKKSLVLQPEEKIVTDSEYSDVRLTVAVSLLNKHSKMKLLMEKLTEIGISGFIPFISERTAFPKMGAGPLRPSMISALKQCGGCVDVDISESVKFDELLELKDFDARYFCDITGRDNQNMIKKGRILAAAGPEGGFTDDEKIRLTEAGFIPIKLNKRTLRAETAAIVTASKFLE